MKNKLQNKIDHTSDCKYKLVSFDIWGTLLKSNPDFVKARTMLFSKSIGCDDLIHMKVVKDMVDIELDGLAENTGTDSNFNTRMQSMLKKLGKNIEDFPESFLDDTRESLSDLFIANLPHLISEETTKLFGELKKASVKIALLSNTGFLHGDTMRPALEKIGVLEHVDFFLFSNEIGYAKPHPNVFKELTKQSGIDPQHILHVGDSVKADYVGACKSGITSVLFDPKNKYGDRMFSIRDIYEVLKIIRGKIPVLHYNNLSLYSLRMESDIIVDQNNIPFDLISYSKFKYGDGNVARQYGHKLAQEFIKTYPHFFENDTLDIVITTSPYKAIVKGSSGIVKGFKNYLNQYLLTLGKSAVVDIVILKKEMFAGDYGSFSDEKRKELMHKNDLYIMEKFIANKKLILIDDARITGSHEANLVSFLVDKGVLQVHFLYIADMEFEFAKEHPDIENTMNHGWVDNLDKLTPIMNSPEFILNARVCKYILSQDNQIELKSFLTTLSNHALYDLYNGIIGDGYSSMDIYKNSFETLVDELKNRQLLKDNLLN